MDNLLVSPDQTAFRNVDVLAAEVDGELVLMSLERGEYVGMALTARRVWELLETPQPLSRVIDQLEIEFEGDRAAIALDVLDYVRDLIAHGLVTIK